MAKVTTNFKALAAKLTVPITGPDSLDSIGEFMVKRIQGFTRLGYSLAGKPATPKSNELKGLSPNYIRWRKNLKAGRTTRLDLTGAGLGIGFSAGRSQLTLSGQLLESLRYVVNQTKKTVRVVVSNATRDDGESNIAISEKQIKAGRPFIGIDQVGIDTIKNRYVKSIMRRLGR